MPEGGLTGPSAMNVLLMAAAALLAMAALVGVVAAVALGRPRRRLRQRMRALGLVPDRRARGMAGMSVRDVGSPRQRRIQERLQELEKAKKRPRGNQIRADLLQAGLDVDYRRYVLAMLLLGAVVVLILANLGLALWLALVLGVIASFGLPKLVLRLIALSRQGKFTAEFATAMDVLVRGMRSGLPVGECLTIIGREVGDPVGQEFRLLVEGQKLGMSLDDLMRRGIERFPTAEYRFFAIVLQIQQQTGGNLADTLEGLSSVLRERKQMRDKVKALSSEAKSSAIIIGSLPFAVAGLVYLMSPDYISLLFTERLGNIMLAGGLLWMSVGVGVMYKMVNFKI